MREIIKLTEYEIAPILYEYAQENDEEYLEEDGEGYKPGVWDDFKIIEENDNYYDLNDGYAEMIVIVQRISDSKYFKGRYTTYTYDGNEYDTTLEEVFPIEKTIIVYE
jgi:hypothetical protein